MIHWLLIRSRSKGFFQLLLREKLVHNVSCVFQLTSRTSVLLRIINITVLLVLQYINTLLLFLLLLLLLLLFTVVMFINRMLYILAT